MAIGTETVEATSPAIEEPIGTGAIEAGRDVVDVVPEERRNGAIEIAVERGAK